MRFRVVRKLGIDLENIAGLIRWNSVQYGVVRDGIYRLARPVFGNVYEEGLSFCPEEVNRTLLAEQ